MSTVTPASTRPHGRRLSTRLTIGFVGLLAILIAVGVESITLLSDLGGSIDVILRENYRSVIACERMKEALERMDSGAFFALAGEAEQRRSLYFQQLLPTFQQIKATADEITHMNQENMMQANDRARKMANDASRRMAGMLLLGIAFAGICIFFLWWSLLGPLERFEAAAAADSF